MCGIFGIFYRNITETVETRDRRIYQMARSVAHRGPDYWGFKVAGLSAVGMVRLSIFDSAEYPVPFEEKNTITAFNGELYNFTQLNANQEDGANGDGGLLARLLDLHGSSAVPSLEGMFAFASLKKDGSSLILGRDRFGEKPIYYRDLGSRVVFASEIKGVLADTLGPDEYPKLSSSGSYNFFESFCFDETEFSDIKQVNPGSVLTFTRTGATKEWTYWTLEDHVDLEKNETLSAEIALESSRKFKEKFQAAVDSRLPNSRPYALLLSGGVDSSLIGLSSRPKFCITGEYELPGFSEGSFPRKIANLVGANHLVVKPTKNDFQAHINEVIWFCDGPVTWTAFNLYMMFKEVAQLGVRVCLTGEGADEAFLGYARHLIYNHAWEIDQSALWPQYQELINKGYGDRAELYLKLTNRGIEGIFPSNILNFYRHIFQKYNGKSESLSVIDMRTTMQILLRMLDRMSMRWGVEARVPFLDTTLFTFGLNLPLGMKIKNFQGKSVIRDAPVGDGTLSLKKIAKKGFAVPYNHWFGGGGYRRDRFADQAMTIFKGQYASHSAFTQSLDRYAVNLPQYIK